MIPSSLPPGLILVIAGLLLPLVPVRLRPVWLIGIPLVVLAVLWSPGDGNSNLVFYLGLTIEPVRVDVAGRLFATIFALMSAFGAIFALGQKSTVELASAQVYAGCAIGVSLAGDLLTLFVFWEGLAVASGLIIWSARTPESYRASMRYIMVHLFGGMLLMSGIALHVVNTGSLMFSPMHPDTIATALILAGFLVNAGAPPLSAWLPDSYPEASWSGSVFLSAFTTKTAVCVLLKGFPGTELLVWVGLYMIFYGIIYALLENDMRRILAYSIVNQVGFMVAGIGIGTEMALNGAAAHAFSHIIYKALLLMSAGSVLLMTGRRKCTDLGGLFQSMPVTAICGIIGALSISSFPLTSGFISKSMISQAAADQHLATVWFLLTAASAGVFLHAGIKFPWFVFFQSDSGLRPSEPPASMRVAMILLAALCLALGVFPSVLYGLLPYPVDYQPYTAGHVLSMLQLLLFSGLAFFLLLPVMKRTLTITLDFDWFYRRLGPRLVRDTGEALASTDRRLRHWVRGTVAEIINYIRHHHGPAGVLARTVGAGSMVFWVVFVLAGYLIAYEFLQ